MAKLAPVVFLSLSPLGLSLVVSGCMCMEDEREEWIVWAYHILIGWQLPWQRITQY